MGTHILGIAAGVWALQGGLQLVCWACANACDVGAGRAAARLALPCLHHIRDPRHTSNPSCSHVIRQFSAKRTHATWSLHP